MGPTLPLVNFFPSFHPASHHHGHDLVLPLLCNAEPDQVLLQGLIGQAVVFRFEREALVHRLRVTVV